MYNSVSALPNQGLRHWVNETGLGVKVGVCFSALSCGPRHGTKQGRIPQNVRKKRLCDPSLLPSRKHLLRNVRTTEVIGWSCSPLLLGALPSGHDTTSAPIDAVCEDASTASPRGGPSARSSATETDDFPEATF